MLMSYLTSPARRSGKMYALLMILLVIFGTVFYSDSNSYL